MITITNVRYVNWQHMHNFWKADPNHYHPLCGVVWRVSSTYWMETIDGVLVEHCTLITVHNGQLTIDGPDIVEALQDYVDYGGAFECDSHTDCPTARAFIAQWLEGGTHD